ncbi:hypothetical protein [Saccharibacillus sacchari]|uniref:Uncharacterized protein n=1 Tax=Saccharibacillus sacchari TaxID=456493 RepID=A0ACC6PA53_9BACL
MNRKQIDYSWLDKFFWQESTIGGHDSSQSLGVYKTMYNKG